ncbi:MAG: hypothetical protein HRT61_24235 [Ekhidna sp.]|nr:hypothetical protein [Ekhidna sp.]
MKWKILIKLLYLVTLMAIAAYEWDKESQLIDSDPNIDSQSMQRAYHME